ncbi:patatin like phospholipase domain containing 3 [Homo sapiens]|uniref:Patatin like domain 3, 1-acylglycerol-3-phosphate O-acyltransferase n=1 Tax=Homo sapiens TaxID=9606 RepID=F8W8E5_HUMAN|nr:patatin like phospholipase domain containing 3 [Homo sapiens]
MYDAERGWSLSFAGCGFLGFYHVGATRCLSEHAPHLLRDARMLFGASAGALHCVGVLSGIPLDSAGPLRSCAEGQESEHWHLPSILQLKQVPPTGSLQMPPGQCPPAHLRQNRHLSYQSV